MVGSSEGGVRPPLGFYEANAMQKVEYDRSREVGASLDDVEEGTSEGFRFNNLKAV